MLGGFRGQDEKHHLDPGHCASCGSWHLNVIFLVLRSDIPLLHCSSLNPFPVCSAFHPQTLSWLKDNVSVATQVCSIANFEGLEAARRCQQALEQEILTNRARIEVVKRVSQDILSYSLFLLKHKRWMNALNENIPHIPQTGHPDRPGLRINQITSWHFIWDGFSYPKLQIRSIFRKHKSQSIVITWSHQFNAPSSGGPRAGPCTAPGQRQDWGVPRPARGPVGRAAEEAPEERCVSAGLRGAGL